jgi:hypothetical protein
LGGDNFK